MCERSGRWAWRPLDLLTTFLIERSQSLSPISKVCRRDGLCGRRSCVGSRMCFAGLCSSMGTSANATTLRVAPRALGPSVPDSWASQRHHHLMAPRCQRAHVRHRRGALLVYRFLESDGTSFCVGPRSGRPSPPILVDTSECVGSQAGCGAQAGSRLRVTSRLGMRVKIVGWVGCLLHTRGASS